MGLISHATLHRHSSRIHCTSHSSLRRHVIRRHTLGLHSGHTNHGHWPRHIPVWNNVGSMHVARNCISRLNRLRRLNARCAFKISGVIHWSSRIIDSLFFRSVWYKCIPTWQRFNLEVLMLKGLCSCYSFARIIFEHF
uniref:Uncharacterized protein n=1 Tax=Opuntia streptacantha TaxID=393608 RepID=A0A7C9EQP5_OPUST